MRVMILFLGAAATFMLSAFATADDTIRFNRDVRSILSNNCYQCHGFDANTREADLRIDTHEGATTKLESGDGQAIVPGKPDASAMIQRILSDDVDERMPPTDSGKKLTKAQIEILRKWVSQGAKYERHWSFVAPQASLPPRVKNVAASRNLVDNFILARLEKEGLAPSPEADRRTLIRRVAFDVTGLPPTRDEIRRFLADKSPEAYEKMVDHYLASHRYGEQMARQWLDLARYADTSGYQYDKERTMWVWRDWVINAYNTNMPFDKFTVEQLAGDLLPNAQPQQVLATGFNRNHPITIEGGVIDEEYRTEYVIDRVVTTTTVWMGLTMGCARCHEHKFDPISQKDFYRMFAFFNQVPERGLQGFKPDQKIASPLAKAHRAQVLAKIVELKKRLAAIKSTAGNAAIERWARGIASALKPDSIPADIRRIAAKKPAARTAAETARLKTYFTRRHAAEAKAIEVQIAALSSANGGKYPRTMVMQDMPNRRTTHLLILGQYDRKGKVVTAGVPEALMPLSKDAPVNRLGFANWLVDPKHPLTARVAVNRYWQQLFGTGIVKTSEDFGTQGEWPSHPALLDTLSTKFVRSGWDVKAMLRLMLTSATYRQSTRASAELRERDPENRLLARGPRFRLDAEQIRDQALAVSGLLVEKVGGPSVYPYQPPGLWMELNNRPGYSRKYVVGKGEALYRRSMYTFWKRTVLSPMLRTFDAPGREFCTVRRSRTNTPLQALLLLQGPQFVEAARNLAGRMMTEGGADANARIAYGFELATARLPSKREAQILSRLYQERFKTFKDNPTAAAKMLGVGDSPRDKKLDSAEHAAWMEVARLLLNLDETVTKG